MTLSCEEGWVCLVLLYSRRLQWVVAQNAAAAQNPSTARAPEKLELRRAVERELGPGLTDEYTVEMMVGQFAHVVAEQKGVNVVVTVAGPDGKVLVKADSPNYELGPEPASWIALESGVYQIRVSKAESSQESGRYRIELTELGVPADADHQRMEAENALFAAVVEDRAGGKEKQVETIGRYERAAALWRGLKDGYEEALCLNRIGALDSALQEKQKALEVYGHALELQVAAGDRAGEARTLNGIGDVYWSLGGKKEALERYEQALPLSRAAEDRSGEAMTLYNLGYMYAEFGEKEKGLEYYGQALSLYRAGGDKPREALTLILAGNVYSSLGENEEGAWSATSRR